MLAEIDWSQLWGSNVEMLAVITGFICVALITFELQSKRLAWWNWPVGIVSSAAFVYVFWDKGLYWNSLLQVFYVVTGFYGLYLWKWGEKKQEWRPIRSNVFSPIYLATWASTVVAAAILMELFRIYDVESAAPFFDALVVTISLAGQIYLTWKYKEQWHFWLMVDLIGMPLFLSQGLYLTTALYFGYTCLVIRGIYTWHKAYNKQLEDESAGQLNNLISEGFLKPIPVAEQNWAPLVEVEPPSLDGE